MPGQEYAFKKIFWKKLRRNKGAVFGLTVIVLALLMTVFAYVIAPDDTPDANRIIVEIAAKKPGYRQHFLKIPLIIKEKPSIVKGFFWGRDESYELIPISS
jgi:ABC-type dipeptide/oligopeptide/nickel transport system permease subunit